MTWFTEHHMCMYATVGVPDQQGGMWAREVEVYVPAVWVKVCPGYDNWVHILTHLGPAQKGRLGTCRP